MGSVLIRLFRDSFTMIDNISAYMQVISPSGQNSAYKDPTGRTCYVGRTTRRQLAEAQQEGEAERSGRDKGVNGYIIFSNHYFPQ